MIRPRAVLEGREPTQDIGVDAPKDVRSMMGSLERRFCERSEATQPPRRSIRVGSAGARDDGGEPERRQRSFTRSPLALDGLGLTGRTAPIYLAARSGL